MTITRQLHESNDLDKEVSKLIDEDNIISVRKAAEQKVSKLDTRTYKYLRRRCKLDLFFLCNNVLGYDKLSSNLHGDLAWWAMRNYKERFKCVLLPRSHYKSTIMTIGDSVRLALPDDSEYLGWPENLGTNIRVLIGHETSEQASKFLVSIAGHFLSNPLLMGLFPECVPNPRKQRINKYELELPRTKIWNEATYDTMGVGGKAQGRHYDYLKLDDLIGDKARDSKAEMQTAKDWIDNVQAFFTQHTRAKMDIIGTRWAFDDLYAHLFNIYGRQLLKYIRSAEEWDDKTQRNVPIFPEEFTIESFEILKKNIKVWSAQYANDPAAGATEFDKNWKRLYDWEGYNKLKVQRYVVGDDITYDHYDVMGMDRVILVDPAPEGKTGFAVTGTTSDDKIFLLESKKHNWTPPQFVDYLFASVSRWQPRLVAIESVNFSSLYQYWLAREMQARGIRFHVEPIKIGNTQKPVRVKGLSNYFAAGQFHWHGSMEDFSKEYDQFGATEDYHILDAVSMGPQVWVKPYSMEKFSDIHTAEEEFFTGRDEETGY